MPFSDIIGLASLYLALLGLLSTFFFIHLGSWLAEIVGLRAKVTFLVTKPKAELTSEKLETYYIASAHSSIWTFIGWVVITLFIAVISVFLEILRGTLTEEDAATVFRFVTVPGLIFVIIYLVASIAMLIRGYKTAKENAKQIQEQI